MMEGGGGGLVLYHLGSSSEGIRCAQIVKACESSNATSTAAFIRSSLYEGPAGDTLLGQLGNSTLGSGHHRPRLLIRIMADCPV